MSVPSDVKLSIYNGALQRLGSRELASLTEGREPRRVLDLHWGPQDRVVKEALEKGEWNFAVRTVQGIYSTTIEPEFGFKRAFDKPSDMRRLAALSADDRFSTSLVATQYSDEAGFWFTDCEIIYVRYVSDDTDYGLNASAWTEAFRTYLECDLAWKSCERITNATSKRDRVERDRMNALKSVKSLDAIAEGVKFLPRGSWSRARRGRV